MPWYKMTFQPNSDHCVATWIITARPIGQRIKNKVVLILNDDNYPADLEVVFFLNGWKSID